MLGSCEEHPVPQGEQVQVSQRDQGQQWAGLGLKIGCCQLLKH